MLHFTLNTEQNIRVPSGDVNLDGLLFIPQDAYGLVLFAHGSGSSRFSTRNQYVAGVLNEAKIATLLFDLFTASEDAIDSATGQFRFNIDFLATRLLDVAQWCHKQPQLAVLPMGYFGASTGGAAALVAAAKKPELVQAVVSRGGRPDLAGEALGHVQDPTLLIVGGDDASVLELNQDALAQMKYTKKLEIVPGASHLFEEPGALEQVAHLAKDWFVIHLKTL